MKLYRALRAINIGIAILIMVQVGIYRWVIGFQENEIFYLAVVIICIMDIIWCLGSIKKRR